MTEPAENVVGMDGGGWPAERLPYNFVADFDRRLAEGMGE